jgi:putative flippase GtrA
VINSIKKFIIANFWYIFRFGIVGVATFLINFSSFHVFYDTFKTPYLAAASLAYFVTVVSHFLANKYFTFAAGAQPVGHNVPRYLAMLALNYLITVASSSTVVEIFHASPYWGVVVATFFTAFSSYVLMRYFVFKLRTETTLKIPETWEN